MGNDASLAGAGTRENQQRPIGLQHCLLLFGIEAREKIQASIVPSAFAVGAM